MGTPLRLIIVEDSQDDAELVVRELVQGGYEPVYKRVETEPELVSALSSEPWELILCDYVMPRFDAHAALKAVKKSAPDVPVIVVSGKIGEDVAVETMRAGAHDYLMKDNLKRLCSAVKRELKDAGERRRAGEAFRQLTRIINQSPAVVILWKNSKGWPVEFVSENVRDVFGYSADDFITGKITYSEIVHPDDLARVNDEVARFSAEEGRTDYKQEPYRIVTKGGLTKWLDDRTFIRRNSENIITHYQGIVLDITDRVEMEQSLLVAEKRFRTFLDSTTDFVYLKDDRHRMVFVNRAMLNSLGRTQQEVLGKTVFDFMPPPAAAQYDATDRRAMESDRVLVSEESLNGRQLETMKFRVDLGGGGTGVGGFIRDITGRKHAEGEKSRLTNQLQQAMKMEAVGRLAGGVAHDFNNLLTGITGNVALALMDLAPDNPLHDTLTEVSKAADSAASLTRQLLAFSRRQVLVPRDICLNELVGNLTMMLVRLIGEDIDLTISPARDLWAVKIDPGQFEQVLVNIIVNARDAMPDGGELVIETANVEPDQEYCKIHQTVSPGRYVMLSVKDTGHGMSEEIKNHLFEPFFTTKPMGRGTGLGLATAYGAVKQAGGFVEIDSELGRGTTFTIYLPMVSQKTEKLIAGDRYREMTGGNATIMLVE
ncbi:MAG: PAS domain S-box protein, partial [Myxococcota bacterium]